MRAVCAAQRTGHFVESGVGTEYHLTFDEWHIFVWLELCVTLIFTGEYLLRLFSWPEPAKYVLVSGDLLIW